MLREEMIEKLDYRFRGSSDCEVVLALYKYYGISFLSRLRGEFSICLYDSKRQLFIAIRDRYGIKPLFWTVQDGRLLVAAEMKAFLPLGWAPEWHVRSIADAAFDIGAGTIFKGVQKVLFIRALGDGTWLIVPGATWPLPHVSLFRNNPGNAILGDGLPGQGRISAKSRIYD